MVFDEISAQYDKSEQLHIVTITVDGESRVFRVFSKRAGQALELLINQFPEGTTTTDMMTKYGIDDNKLYGELKDESAFGEFLFKDGRRDNKNLWKIDLDLLWSSSSNLVQPIWFGIHEQTDLRQFLPELERRQGLRCNILGVHLLREPHGEFLSNFRKIAIDHRIPKARGGLDELNNMQILSYYVNERKNQICARCPNPDCNNCVLAFPETASIVIPTGEDITSLMDWRNHEDD